MGDAKTSRRVSAKVLVKQEQALEMFLLGKSNQEIADKMGYRDRSGAHNAITAALARHSQARADLSERAMTVMMERLERLLFPHYIKGIAGDRASGELALRIFDRISKLQGLDAAVKIDATVTTRSELDAELEALSKQITDAATRRE